MKKYKKNSFFSIHNVNLKKSVDNFCSIVKLHFLKTKIQNRIYRDFEHHFLTNCGKIIFLKIPYIWEFYGFFRKKNKKTRIFNLLIHCIFNIFLRKKSKNDFFFPIVLVLVHIGISTPFKHRKRRKNFLESLKSVTCSRFHQDMFAANDNMSNELLKNDT